MLLDLADVLRYVGLKVIEVPDWQTNQRPASAGGFEPQANLWHHTGAKDTNPLSIVDDLQYANWLAHIGRSDLAAPLCQVSVGRDGTCYVCAAGRGNHAGKARASGPVPAGDGNRLYLGWECQNTGSEGWTKAQYDAMVTGAAATSIAYGWTAAANRAHKETSTTGKWDPGLLDMTKFRRDIAARITDLEDDMFTPEDRALLEKLVADEKTRAQREIDWEKRAIAFRDRTLKALRSINTRAKANSTSLTEIAADTDRLIAELEA